MPKFSVIPLTGDFIPARCVHETSKRWLMEFEHHGRATQVWFNKGTREPSFRAPRACFERLLVREEPTPATEDPPELCDCCRAKVQGSGLEWVKAGGMNVGLTKQPLVWRLRDRYSSGVIHQNAKYSQRLAAASRLLSDIHERGKHRPRGDDSDLRDRIEKFLRA